MKTVWCALLLASCVSAQEGMTHLRLRRIDDHVYGGRQPKEANFAALKRMGIRTVLDLRGGSIHKPRERKWVEAAGMHYFSVRLSGIFPPEKPQIAKILALLEDPTLGPFYVHCRRGADRVGMVIASYRIAHDRWTNQQAFDEARGFGLNRFELLMKRYIRTFDPAKLPPVSADQSLAAKANSGH
jgi:tyrosine-protein phosphatase SIW14